MNDVRIQIVCDQTALQMLNGATVEVQQMLYESSDADFEKVVGLSKYDLFRLQKKFLFELDRYWRSTSRCRLVLQVAEVRACVNAIELLIAPDSDLLDEVHTRTGCTPEEFQQFAATLRQALDSADSALRAQAAASQCGCRLKNLFRKIFKQTP